MAVSRASRLRYARIAKKHGMSYARTIADEASKAGLPISLGFALAEQETTTCRNVFGHDPVRNPAPKGGKVTKDRYLAYKRWRKQGLGMQGVGPLQLTWYATQDAADRLYKGFGCAVVRYNLRVGFRTLAALIRTYGYVDGIRRYNGSGPAATAYSRSVRSKATKWHNRLK